MYDGVVGGEERHHTGDVVGLAFAPHRDGLRERGAEPRRRVVAGLREQRGVGGPGHTQLTVMP